MPSLADLANNLSNFQYYSGLGNFNANSLPASDGQLIVKEPGQKWSLGLSDTLTPFGAVTTVNRTLADVKRVTKFLFTTPQGPQFLIKQTGLQFSNPYLEHDGEALPTDKPTKGQGFFGNVGNSISNFANKISNDYGPTRIYNPLGLSTLAEVGLVAAGVRLNKHGLLPGNTDTNDYINYILKKDGDGNNRLYQLGNQLSDRKNIQINVLEYKGGAGSTYGIGKTTIRRFGNLLTGIPIIDPNSGAVTIPIGNMMSINSFNEMKLDTSKPLHVDASSDLRGADQPEPPDNNFIAFGDNIDFRTVKNKIAGSTVLASSDYTKLNIEKRVGIARARKNNEDRTNYALDVPEASDKINKLSLFYGTSIPDAISLLTKDINDNQVTGDNTNDLVKFRIKSFDNDSSNKGGVYMVFRAYLNNIKRGIQSKWSPYNYVGRGESFYLYDGFTENITFQFTVMASSRSEMKPLYQKLNYLISTLTPDYNKQNRMRGNISELTIGDFIKYQPGVITSLDIIVDEDTNWEIAINEGNKDNQGIDYDMHELPHMLKCNMTFIPIYNFLPRKSAEAPFIGIDDPVSTSSPKNWTSGVNSKIQPPAKK
jgi:hypothetical protein